MNPYPYDLSEGLFTSKPGVMYYCCLSVPDKLFLSCISNPIKAVTLLRTGEALSYEVTWSEASMCHDLVIDMPVEFINDNIIVIKIEIEGNTPVFENIFR